LIRGVGGEGTVSVFSPPTPLFKEQATVATGAFCLDACDRRMAAS